MNLELFRELYPTAGMTSEEVVLYENEELAKRELVHARRRWVRAQFDRNRLERYARWETASDEERVAEPRRILPPRQIGIAGEVVASYRPQELAAFICERQLDHAFLLADLGADRQALADEVAQSLPPQPSASGHPAVPMTAEGLGSGERRVTSQ